MVRIGERSSGFEWRGGERNREEVVWGEIASDYGRIEGGGGRMVR